MLPVRNETFLPDAQKDLTYISAVICAAFTGVEPNWEQIECVFEDDLNYLSISGVKHRVDESPTVNVEFGVQDENDKRAVGGLMVSWCVDRSCVEGLVFVLLDGVSCDLTLFANRLSSYAQLPLAVKEVAELDD